jgi:ABC-type sugar transport system, periplasmic component
MRRKLLSAALSLTMVATLFSGCGSDGGSKKGGDDSKGKVYYLNFKPEQGDDWKALAEEYTKESGVEVKVVTAASNTYEQTLKSEMAKSDAPTLFQVNGPVGLATWKDYCYDLKDSDLYKQVKSDEFVLKDGDAVPGIAYVIETYGIIYNKSLLKKYCEMDGAKVKDASEISSFAKLKEVADDIQAKKKDLGVDGAFTSAGMDSSSIWRYTTHLANLPIYYEYKADSVTSSEAIKGTYLDQYKQMFDLYLEDSTCDPKLLASKTGDESMAEFATGKAVFYQNGTWAYGDITKNGLKDEDLGMLPIYIGVDGEEEQGLCTGSENYWCVNSKASESDIKATLDFMNWCATSDKGRDKIANTMGFVTPFKAFDDGYSAKNPLIQADSELLAAGKTPVSWNFSTIPSEEWKNNLGAALTEYAQGTGKWDNVKTAFVDGWAEQYQATH